MNSKILFGAGLVVGIAAVAAMRLAGGNTVADVSYSDLPLSAKVASAPLIVTGTVLEVTPSRWNQDDGTFWEKVETDAFGQQTVDTAVPYHTVVVQVDRTLANRDGVGTDKLTLTIVGMGSDAALAASVDAGGVTSLASDTVSAAEGERVIAFVRPGQLAWRDGTMRPVLVPMGAPGSTVVSEAAVNGGALSDVASFDALVAQVEHARAVDSATE
ncbi:MAG: hypothetical protein IPG72_08345 [Ardenticatenales bacterium]|nr:hypothetical protein [Ardenticatenales bacterium]